MPTPPTPTAAGTPTGFKMPDGFSSTIVFASKASLGIWEKQVKPPGMDGGEPIDTSTMRNSKFHTMHPRSLQKVDSTTVSCAYDPDAYADLQTLVNFPDTVTVHWPTHDSVCAYGFLQKAEFGELKEGEFPEVTLTIAWTNTDATGAEAGPVYTASGT